MSEEKQVSVNYVPKSNNEGFQIHFDLGDETVLIDCGHFQKAPKADDEESANEVDDLEEEGKKKKKIV